MIKQKTLLLTILWWCLAATGANANANPATRSGTAFQLSPRQRSPPPIQTRRRRSHVPTITTTSSALRMSLNSRRRVPAKQVFLIHERDFFRQMARLESMESYVLVSTLTSSMSFGALLGFTPSAATKAILQTAFSKFVYRNVCMSIQIASGLSAICGLYAAIVFSLTILYGKSALGAERDMEYDQFIQSTARARVHGLRCFTCSLGLFALDAVLVLVERTFYRFCFLPVFGISSYVLYKLYKDWKLIFDNAAIIYND